MTHVSKKRIKDNTLETLDKALEHVFKNLSQSDVKSLFASLFTKTEKTMLLKRIGIISLLEQKASPESISKITATTRQTVARIRLQLLEVAEKDKKILYRKIKAFNAVSDFKKLVEGIVKLPIGKSDFYRKIKKLS